MREIEELSPSVLARLNSSKILVLDVETTGVRYSDRITELAMLYIDRGNQCSYSTLMNPEMPIPSIVQGLTGITDEMVCNSPTERDLCKGIKEILDTSDIVVGHNVKFDIGFLSRLLERNGLSSDFDYIDTLKLSKSMLKLDSYKLVSVATYFGVTPKSAHRAMVDVETTRDVLYKLCEMVK